MKVRLDLTRFDGSVNFKHADEQQTWYFKGPREPGRSRGVFGNEKECRGEDDAEVPSGINGIFLLLVMSSFRFPSASLELSRQRPKPKRRERQSEEGRDRRRTERECFEERLGF